MTKRKISYEQSLALAYGQRIARTNQRRRVAARQEGEKAAAEREQKEREHAEKGLHGWTNWEYDFDNMTESRACRECGEVETRNIRPL